MGIPGESWTMRLKRTRGIRDSPRNPFNLANGVGGSSRFQNVRRFKQDGILFCIRIEGRISKMKRNLLFETNERDSLEQTTKEPPFQNPF